MWAVLRISVNPIETLVQRTIAALAGCRLLKFSFRAWQNYCILSLLSLGNSPREYWSIFLRKIMLSFEFLLWLSAILKLDFSKSLEKSLGAKLPRGMKLGNSLRWFWIFFNGLAKSPGVLRSSWLLNEYNLCCKIVKYCISSEVCMIKTVPHSSVSSKMWCGALGKFGEHSRS